MSRLPSPLRQGVKIALIYAGAGALWIALSDRLVESLAADGHLLTQLQTAKGWAFVALSALLILALTRRDITRERAAVVEREALMGEIHHRVRNNLQLIISLLAMEAAKHRDADTRRGLDDALVRVQAVGLVHNHLYESGDFSRIDFSHYARDLCCSLSRVMAPEHVALDLRLEAFECAPQRVIPLGMILVELLTNAYKHGFPHRKGGTITVRLTRRGGRCVMLEVADDGIGLPGAQLPTGGTGGLARVHMFAQQLDGRVVSGRSPAGGAALRIEMGCETCPDGTRGGDGPDAQATGAAARS